MMSSDERAEPALVRGVPLFVKGLMQIGAGAIPEPLYGADRRIHHLGRLGCCEPAKELTLDHFAQPGIFFREPLEGFVEIQKALTSFF